MNRRSRSRLIEWLIVAVVVGVLGGVAGGVFLLQIPLQLLFGWLTFLQVTLPHVQISGGQLLLGCLAVLVLLVAVHGFLGWLVPGRWCWRSSCSVVGLFLLMFVTSIAFTGTVHQLGWLLRDRVVISDWDLRGIETRNVMSSLLYALEEHREMQGHYPVATGAFPLEENAVDEWGRALYYQSLDGRSYLLRSDGYNGIPGGGIGRFDDLIVVDGEWLGMGR